MDKISAKQIEGVVDTNTSQNIQGEKTFMNPTLFQTSLNDSVYTMCIDGSFVYWLQTPGIYDFEGNKRLGINPKNGEFGLQMFQFGQWVNFNF
jgi:hypothetical protein